jgi:ATP-binding cassette subfamily B multidrug efflux pump
MPSKKNGSKSEKLSFFKEFRTLGVHVREYRRAYIVGLLFLILTDAGQIVIPRLMGRSVDLISAGRGAAREVGVLMLAVVLLAVLVAVGRYGWRNYIIGSARRIEADLRVRLYDKMLTLSGSFYSRHKVGDLMARATNDLHSVRMATGMALIAFVDGVFMTIVILATLFIGYGRLGLLVVAPLPLVTFMALFLGRLVGPMFRRVQENFARISEHVQETLAGIRVIKSFVREKRALDAFQDINADYGRANMSLIRFWGMLFPAMGFVAGLSVLLLLYFGGIRVIDGRMSPGDFIAALSYLGMLIWPAMGAGWVVNMMQRGAASMHRINEVLDEIPDICDDPDADDTVPMGDLEFRSVSYSYDGAEPILKDVSFTAPAGKSTGILGRTGSGKTTLVKLIPRLLDPPPGTILIGGRDIRMSTRSALRKKLGIVPQDVFLFSDTIRANIVFANPEASPDEVETVVDAAGLRADLPFFPQGLDTLVGERGVTLSGGQKQRIAIARAIIADPDMLVLDDALSAVDADTEERILGNLFEVRRGRTTLMISHRVSALSRCDRCIVLEDGMVSADGTHQELLAMDGFYREIAELQKLEHIEEESA